MIKDAPSAWLATLLSLTCRNVALTDGAVTPRLTVFRSTYAQLDLEAGNADYSSVIRRLDTTAATPVWQVRTLDLACSEYRAWDGTKYVTIAARANDGTEAGLFPSYTDPVRVGDLDGDGEADIAVGVGLLPVNGITKATQRDHVAILSGADGRALVQAGGTTSLRNAEIKTLRAFTRGDVGSGYEIVIGRPHSLSDGQEGRGSVEVMKPDGTIAWRHEGARGCAAGYDLAIGHFPGHDGELVLSLSDWKGNAGTAKVMALDAGTGKLVAEFNVNRRGTEYADGMSILTGAEDGGIALIMAPAGMADDDRHLAFVKLVLGTTADLNIATSEDRIQIPWPGRAIRIVTDDRGVAARVRGSPKDDRIVLDCSAKLKSNERIGAVGLVDTRKRAVELLRTWSNEIGIASGPRLAPLLDPTDSTHAWFHIVFVPVNDKDPQPAYSAIVDFADHEMVGSWK